MRGVIEHSVRAARAMVATLLLAAAVMIGTPAAAQNFPPFTGLVTDAANILPADRKAALTEKLEALQQQTGRQLVVATIPDLQGYPIEDYGYRLGRTWGVGLKGADNGIILFIAPNEPAGHRGPRIEVGRRLEPVVTDAFASVVINTQMIPRLRGGDVPGALDAGADALIAQLRLPDDQARAENAKAAAEFDRTHRRAASGAGGVPFGLIVWGAIIAFILLASLRRHGRGQRFNGGGSNWPIWLWAASDILSSSRNSGGGWGSGGGGGWGSGGGGGSDGSWMGGGFTGGGGGDFGGGGASGDW